MTYKILLVVAVAAITAAQGNVTNERIVGGEPTNIESYPSIVQVESSTLGISWGQSCAANIINTKYALSAAHCFASLFGGSISISTRRLRAGTTNRNSDGIIIQLSRALNHPSYGQTLFGGADGDISLIEMQNIVQFTPLIQAVPIVTQNFQLPDGLPVIHAGWGATAQGGAASPTLRDVTIFTINHDICRDRYLRQLIPQRVTENMICAGILDVGGKDACQGDSGGPLYFQDILIGIVSWGRGCADPHFPGVSTKISSYTDWITENAI